MNAIRLMTCVVLLSSCAVANAEGLDTLHWNDAAWVKDAGERLARCAGTYRGAAEVMRRGGREQAAAYADAVGSGALFAAYVLLTSPAVFEAKVVLHEADANVHIVALAWGSKRDFIAMDEQRDPTLPGLLRTCTQTSSLQSSVLRGPTEIPTAAEADLAP